MRIITLSSDGTNLLHPEAPVAERFKRYGRLVECFDALTLGPEDVEAALSEAVRVHVVRKAGLFSGMLRLVRRFGVLVRQNRYDLLSTRDPYYLEPISKIIPHQYHQTAQ